MSITFLTDEDAKKFVKKVNGTEPDEDGNVEIETGAVKTVNHIAPDKSGNVDVTRNIHYSTQNWVTTKIGSYYSLDYSALTLNGAELRENDLVVTAKGHIFVVGNPEVTDGTIIGCAVASLSGKLDADKLPEAINNALAQAKASGEFDGKDGSDGRDGINGENGHSVFYCTYDVKATESADILASYIQNGDREITAGDMFITPSGWLYKITGFTTEEKNIVFAEYLSVLTTDGADGVGIESIEQNLSTESGGINLIVVTLTDGTVKTFFVRNGLTGKDGYNVFYSSYVNPNPGINETVGNTYYFDVSSFPITLHGRTLRIGDMVMTSEGVLYKVTNITTDRYQLYCAVNMRVRDIKDFVQTVKSTESGGANAFRVDFSDNTNKTFEIYNGVDGNGMFFYEDAEEDVEFYFPGDDDLYQIDIEKVVLNGKTLRVGDLLYSNTRYLFQVSRIDNATTYYAKCIRFVGCENGLSVHYYDDSYITNPTYTIGSSYTHSIANGRTAQENDLVISNSGYLFVVTRDGDLETDKTCRCVAKLYADIPTDAEIDTLMAEIV